MGLGVWTFNPNPNPYLKRAFLRYSTPRFSAIHPELTRRPNVYRITTGILLALLGESEGTARNILAKGNAGIK